MDDLCSACLCSGRNLYLLNEIELNNIYQQIVNEVSDPQCVVQCVQVCWECRALLRRFQRFRDQVRSCYVELVQCLRQTPSTTPRARTPRLQLRRIENRTHDTHTSLSIKEEDQLKLTQEIENDIHKNILKSEKEEDYDEPETVAYDFIGCEDQEEIAVKKDKRNKLPKKKVKKKVKLKKSRSKKKKTERETEHLSDASDRAFEPGLEFESGVVDGCELEVNGEVNSEEQMVQPVNGIVKKRAPRSKEVLPEKPTCTDCGKTFSSRKTYRYHRNVLHRGQNRYPCPRCGRVYQWKSNLGRHMRTHKARDTGELYCEKCDKSFASVATYRQHLRISRRHVPESDYTFMCNECGKKFVDKTRLRDHIDWEHLKKVKYRCQICNNAFKCHTTLYVHMQNIHTNKEKKENLCHVCGKSYQNASKLKYHIVAMHTSETPHRCAQCGAAFGWYSSLYRHVRELHYGVKVPAKNVKKSKKLLRDLLMHPENPLAQSGPP